MIHNTQWATKDKITAFPKLKNMVEDGINSTDNIHPQYWDKLSFWESFTKNLEGTANVTTIKTNLIASHYFLSSAYVGGAEDYRVCGTFQFIRGITTEIIAGARVKTTVNTGINLSDVKFRISAYKKTYADPSSKPLLNSGSVQNGSGSYADYSATLDISDSDPKDLIVIDFEIKIDNVFSQAGRIGEGIFANPYYTRTEPQL